MEQPQIDLETLVHRVIGSAIEVHRTLGPGLLESVYRECLLVELQLLGFRVETERAVPIEYKGRKIKHPLRIDLLVDGRLVVEIKAMETLLPVHSAQVITYLKLTGCPAGLLLNFNTTSLRNGMRRLEHPGRFRERIRALQAAAWRRE